VVFSARVKGKSIYQPFSTRFTRGVPRKGEEQIDLSTVFGAFYV
jgi:hypothetical protein